MGAHHDLSPFASNTAWRGISTLPPSTPHVLGTNLNSSESAGADGPPRACGHGRIAAGSRSGENVKGVQKTHNLRLLRTRHERTGGRAAEQRDEFAAFHHRAHSIISSARA